jgi:arylsulfatase A-like enzyme
LVPILAVLALAGCDRVGPHDGYAVLDTSVYADATRDAQPATDVVRRSDTAPARPPNVVIILADDLGYGDLGAYGNTLLRTPNLDALARAGARFTNFYAAESTCSASRAGLLTGRYALRSGMNFPLLAAQAPWLERMFRPLGGLTGALGMMDTVQADPPPVAGLPASEITLPEALQLAGYATGMVGKWHLGDFSADPRHHPRRHGFDFFAGFPHSNDLFPYSYWKDDALVEADLGSRQTDITATLTREAIGFIEANRSQPFLLYYAHKNVHTPLFPSPAFAGRSEAGPYGDSVEELDASVGEIVNALASRGLLDDTLVVFTSDNGPWHLGSPGGLRGRKGQALEGGQRVPAIAQWPGQIPGGRVVDAPAMSIDLFPTLLALAGLELPRDRVIDGRDLAGLLTGRETESPHDALFFFNANIVDGTRSGRWKYYRSVHLYTWPTPLDKKSTLAGRWVHANRYTDPQTGEVIARSTHDPLLFDVVADRDESYNVISRHPDEATRLHAAIEAWEREFFANPRGWR